MAQNYLIYGAYGYTGELIARLAVERGQKPILGGRNPEKLAWLAEDLGLEERAFRLQDPEIVEARLEGVDVVVHCAGPFSRTFRPMSEACLRTGAHYLDITGEVEVFESLAARDEEAREAGIMLMPGVGFDVVPSDCLALHLKGRLPGATHLSLAIQGLGRISRGTAATMVENLHRGGLVRRDGRLETVPAAWKSRSIDFGDRAASAVTIPWGDLTTAYHSTGIPNLEVYMAMPALRQVSMRLMRYLGWLLGSRPMQAFLKSRIRSRRPGPTADERAKGGARVWGEVQGPQGETAVSRLETPEGYTFTALSTLAVIDRVMAGEAPLGFQTPAMAYGPDFVLEIDGVKRMDG